MKRSWIPLSITPIRVAALMVAVGLLITGVRTETASAAGSHRHKLDGRLRQALDREGDWPSRRVIVRVDPKAVGSLRKLLQGRGDRLIRFHGGISAFTVESRHLLALAGNPAVASISEDVPVDAHQVAPPAALPTSQVVRSSVSLPGAWTGAGVGVAVIDSGIEPSADFAGRISAFYDFTRGGIAAAPFDDYGHGTHVAGLIASSGALSAGAYAGLAPNVRLVGLKVLDGSGGGFTSDVIHAVEFATANRAALGVDIINLSLGHPPAESAATDPLVQAVEAAVRAGIVVVASAGNYGRNPVTRRSATAASPRPAPRLRP